MVSDPERPRYMKYDRSILPDYQKLIIQEAKNRQELMIQIMKSRGVIYDPALIIQKQKEDRIRKEKYREERNRLLKQRLL